MNTIARLFPLFILVVMAACGASTSTANDPAAKLVGEWKGLNSTQTCVPTGDPCYSITFTVTFTNSGTYSIVTSDGGADAGTYTATATKITTVTASIKTSACFTADFLSDTAYTLSSDGKTLTIPVCPIVFTKQ